MSAEDRAIGGIDLDAALLGLALSGDRGADFLAEECRPALLAMGVDSALCRIAVIGADGAKQFEFMYRAYLK